MIIDSHRKGIDNIVIVGDFNMPGIDWETWNGKTDQDVQIIEVLQDLFMYQHIDEPTRYRIGQIPSLLDLVISSKEELVRDVKYMDPLGKSDHLCICFTIDTDPDINSTSQQRYRMDKGKYDSLTQMMIEVNWRDNTKDMDIDETWNHYRRQYDQAVESCIPKYTARTAKWRRPMWMNGKAIKTSKMKYWAWKRYKSTGRYEDFERYCRKRNKATELNNKLRRDFEKLIAREAKTKPKAFWKYVKSQTSARDNLSPLEKPDGELTENDTDKAEVLNNFFASVFTKENLESMPDLPEREFNQPVNSMEITTEEVEKLMTKSKTR